MLAQGSILHRNGGAVATPAKRRAKRWARIGTERVRVKNDAERVEAERIIDKLRTTHAVAINSRSVVESVKAGYPHAPERQRKKVRTRHWKLWELQALEKAADNFGPILGAARRSSTRASVPQEVTTAGKVEYSIDVDKSTGKIDPNTVGEYFSDDQSLGLFKPGETYGGIFGRDVKKKREMTAHHEMAHGLMAYAIDGFVTASGYWQDQDLESGDPNAEAPPTDYGKTNAREDLSESVALYFVDRQRLQNGDGSPQGTAGNACPLRCAYIDQVVKGWIPPPPPPPAPAAKKKRSFWERLLGGT